MTAPTDRTRRPFVVEDARAILMRTPAALDSLLRGLPPAWIAAHEGGETWSPFDVMGHLIHGEETDWIPRAKIILEHGDARAFDTFDRLAQFRASAGRTLPELLDDFARLRSASLRGLDALRITAADLDRAGRHPALGAVTCASCSRPGWRTISTTSSRYRGRSPVSTRTRSDRGARTSASSTACRAEPPAIQ